jgi:hypothetical protein
MDGNFTNTMPQGRMNMNVSMRGRKWGRVVLAIVLVLGALYWIFCDQIMKLTMVKSEYQSVFLSNGQVYFGKLSFNKSWIVLEDVYYLQVTDELQPATGSSGTAVTPTADAQQKIQLVKLGSELHGPQDHMYIDRDSVLFWENMKDDAKVLQSIEQAKTQ